MLMKYDDIIKNAATEWDNYSVYMMCSLLHPTIEKEGIDISKMKIKDVYAMLNKQDHFNIKNYYEYINKLKSKLEENGYETKSFIQLTFKEIKEL